MVVTKSKISDDVRVYDAYTNWISEYWPQGYIEHCMTTYDELQPKTDMEDSKNYQRRRNRTLRNLEKRYANCNFRCSHQDCETKRRRSYYFHVSSQTI